MGLVKENQKIYVKASSAFQVVYEGEAVSVSSENKTGKFDILYNHTNFISWLNDCDVDINKGKDDDHPDMVKIHIEQAVITVSDNKVYIFLV